MRKLRQLGKTSKETWNALSKEDAMFYILTNKDKRGGAWNLHEFLDTGQNQWQRFKNLLSHYGLERVYSSKKGIAVDIGCGMGRVTLAMCKDFEQVIGVDVSEDMIEKANVNMSTLRVKNCEFLVNNGADLFGIPDQSVDFCFSYLTLQHCPSRKQVLYYISEFSRVLKVDGVALFQFRVASTWFIYFKFAIGRAGQKLWSSVFKQGIKDNHTTLDAVAGNWVPLTQAYRQVSGHFRTFYLVQTPVELYEHKFWDLGNEFERWKRSFWICIK